MICDTTGKAILLSDETDLELDNTRDHPATPTHSKNGVCANCPNWLGDSSPKTKRLAALAAMMLLSFVAVMIVGIAKPSSSSTDNAAGGGGGIVSQNQNKAIDSSRSTAPIPVPTTTSPEPIRPDTATAATSSPTQDTAATSSPTQDSVIVPISNSKVNIQLPSFVETKVPDFSNGLNVTEEQNWNLVEATLERTIHSSLSAELDQSLLTADYSLESIQVHKFDGFVTSFIRKRTLTMKEGWANRHLQQTGPEPTEPIHTVFYSSSVTVNCLGGSKCSSARNTVANAAAVLSNLDFVVALGGETDAPSPVVITRIPTKSPITAIISTLAPISTTPTLGPSASPVKPVLTSWPTSGAPVTLPPPPPLEDRRDSCNIYTPCEMCEGLCDSDDQCEEGLLCFLRRGYEFIPGCEGPGNRGISYCYDPFATGLTEAELLHPEDEDCDKEARCGKCRGEFHLVSLTFKPCHIMYNHFYINLVHISVGRQLFSG